MQSLTITRPDDWHVHLRDKEALINTVGACAAHFERALVMPNLKPALSSLSALLAYRQRILAAVPTGSTFQPMMTFYLNEQLTPEDLEAGLAYPYLLGAKLYPAGATTNSAEGVQGLKTIFPLLELMQQHDLVLQIHAELAEGDIFPVKLLL